ncbi:MAG: copper amine oxidase N-terminal domain-containing protein, partial [bacterium]
MKRVLRVVFLLGFLIFLHFPCGVVSYSNQPEEEVILLQIGSTNLWKNGQPGTQMDVAPFIEANRTWVPVRFVSEALGAEVKWRQEEQQVYITMGGNDIILTIGSNSLVFNGKSQTMDVAPFLRSNRTWVPLRFVAENLGCTVSWVQGSQEVVIRRGPFSGPTVAFVQNGQLIMSEVSGDSPGAKRVLAEGNVTGEEISGPFAWSFNGIKIAYYRIQKLDFDFFRLSLEYQIEPSGVS